MTSRRMLLMQLSMGAGIVVLGASAAWSATGIEYLAIPTPLKAATRARYADNCVGFLRNDMKIRLPNIDLTSWQAKQSIVNVSGDPRRGDVAVIAVPRGIAAPYGHVAMVESVTATSITILEANFRSGTVTMRRATGRNLDDAKAQLRIYGFYRP